MPRVSVVIPVYNVERYLPQCLDSVIEQTFRDIEIICVNDGSTDGSLEILHSYSAGDERLRVITQQNQGVSVARNRGFDESSGDYILFLDSDDTFERDMIEQVLPLCADNDADIGMFRIRYVYDDTGESVEADWSLRMDVVPDEVPFSRHDVAGNIFLQVTPCVWNKMFKRSFLEDNGIRFASDLARAEDVPFTYLALALAERIVVVDKALVNYRTGLADSRQATIHELPFEICRALLHAKRAAFSAGVYQEIERDLVNAALHQCLFTLSTLKTPSAFMELYEGLKSTWFGELGISGRDREFFQSEGEFEQYEKILAMSPEEYLFDSARSLASRLSAAGERANRLSTGLAESKARIEALNADVNTLRDEVSDARGKLKVSRDKLKTTKENLRTTKDSLAATKAKLRKIKGSRSYRISQKVARIPRTLRRLLSPRAAE